MGKFTKNNIQYKFIERVKRNADLKRTIEMISNPAILQSIEKMNALNRVHYLMQNVNRHYDSYNWVTNALNRNGIHERAKSFSKFSERANSLFSTSQRSFLQFLMHSNVFTEILDDTSLDQKSQIELIESPKIIVVDQALKIQGIIKSIYDDNSQLFKVAPRNFEEVIAELLSKKGLNVSLTKQTRDGGYDILAIEETGFTINKYLVECKRNRHDRPVDVGVVKQLRTTMIDNNANKGILFTSSYFTTEAEKMRKMHDYMLDFKNGADIIDWIRAYINKPGS